MELPLLDLYPLELEIVTFECAVKHLKYINNNTLEWHCYDEPLQNNVALQEWEIRKKPIRKNSAIYSHQNSYNNKSKYQTCFEFALDREFEEITTTLPVSQQLFRDTKLEDLPETELMKYMPTSLVPGVYINNEYNISLILTVKSTGIKCHYYGDTDGICEWEVLLPKGLLLTETKRYFIPKIEEASNGVLQTTRLVIELDVTNQTA